ncbi:hypothetical protein I6I18_05570 [Kytococcus sedentarius]|uniref:Uncharacterized protein n=1 Tax=Kytococcus sedentarius (strain ATCC 14392 / DSM 20547 / JCM 11482 / CCUG 33030 / NBRC 15357 / NCTC 11040 / CCM 314 / 541) TaxID=478801 RepID=C7NI69_KYTSD|nr:hypothetical protein [Kytococcus sedentarius]ACV06576.1 hypothetical protein Ksed_15610 [Kytococcus sedentarius DSM 20547]QQB64875.1 hypothetical protein I6I18_05570 [Kytococcus sedentarius]QRO86474.1 hypothetical protein I6J30_06155 [Kytococcus sedentarius]STX14609.1 Uncharacterised protein [Kytococcus sedentarius]
MTPLLLEANATDTSWVPGAVAAAVTGGVGVLMMARSGALPVPVKGVVRSMSIVALMVAAALLVLGWQGMGWLPLALVTVVALLLLLAGTGLLAARAQRLTRAARGHRDD